LPAGARNTKGPWGSATVNRNWIQDGDRPPREQRSRTRSIGMNRNLWLVGAALVLLGTMTASAQKTELKANVPFDFIVNGSTFPAGEYTLRSVDVQGKVLSISGVNSQTQGMIASNDKLSS